jgi:tetratricopeptide (TPR) repeat protein
MTRARYAAIGLLFLFLGGLYSVETVGAREKTVPLAQAAAGFLVAVTCLVMSFKKKSRPRFQRSLPVNKQELQQSDQETLGRRALGFKVEEKLNVSGCIFSAFALVSLLLVIGGAAAGAHFCAGLAEGRGTGILLGVVGAIVGFGIVGLFVVFIVFPWAVMESWDDDPQKKIKQLQESLQSREDLGTWYELGSELELVGQRDEARDAYLKALTLQTDDPEEYTSLGRSLETINLLHEATDAYRKAIQLNSESTHAHMALGMVLHAQGRIDEAIAEYREVLRIGKYHGVENQLGLALRDRGVLDEAMAWFRKADENQENSFPGYVSPHAEAVRETKLMIRVADRLPAVLEGKDRFGSTAECLACARLCQLPFRKQYAASARFFAEAFAREPTLAEDMQKDYRYFAARSAAPAGCGQGEDGANLDEADRAALRLQAQDWLRADLNAWSSGLSGSAETYEIADKHPGGYWMLSIPMQRWLKDPLLACVREPEWLARFPEDEKHQWQQIWSSATNMLNRGDAREIKVFLKPA